jgi:hypothetical protein
MLMAADIFGRWTSMGNYSFLENNEHLLGQPLNGEKQQLLR